MKSTGVIRRIDELGRIVIPKEIRRNLGIRDGENIEIFTEKDDIILKKYYRMSSLVDLAKDLCEIIYRDFKYKIIITDREKVIATNPEDINLINKKINKECQKIIFDREKITLNNHKFIIEDKEINGNFLFTPIISLNDSLGLIIIYSNSGISTEEKIAKLASSIITQKLDI